MSTRLWDTDDEYSAAAHAGLPTPKDTPYRTRTPSRTSRKSKRNSNSPRPMSSSPVMPRNSRDFAANDESISILDPRRFTPELHASLVNEILKLRGDQEEKTRLVESLESQLHEEIKTREGLEQTLGANGKETRSLKRQLDLLEGGTSSALEELATERDEAVESASDIRRRVESIQKKQRSQEEDLDRTNELYSRDKENWAAERRRLERQIHVTEGRLKAVISEVAAFQAAQEEDEELANGLDHGDGNGNDNASLRSMSITHSRTNSIRFSAMNGFGADYKGVSLADELNMDTDDEQETDGGRESSLSNHIRHQSRDSMMSLPKSHRRNMSNFFGIPEETTTQPKPEYVDTGVQFSPPPSPKLEPTVIPEIFESKPERPSSAEAVTREWEVEANQRRKRVHAPLVVDSKSPVVSTGCQTLEEPPPSPPRTPRDHSISESMQRDSEVTTATATASISTQTDSLHFIPPSPTRPPPQPPLVPMISIHPPESRPTTPRPVGSLPAYFKDASCQVFLPPSASYCSVSMQTEEIRVRERLTLLPPHLQPSAISSVPPTPERDPENFAIPPKSPRRVSSNSSIQSRDPPSSPPVAGFLQAAYDAYPGNNDDGPLSKHKNSIRRPHRISSLFAGFDDKSSDDGDFAEGELSDSDFRTALSAPKHQSTQLKRGAGPTSVPEEEVLEEMGNGELTPPTWTGLSERRSSKGSVFISTAKQATMRKAALISSGVAVHADGLPGLEGSNEPVPPPFPIPNRASSRQPPHSASAPSDGTRSPTPVESFRDNRASNGMRKAAANLPKRGNKYRRRGSRSPPPLSISTEGPGSPQLPPMPNNNITSPSLQYINEYTQKKSYHRQQPSSNTAGTEATGNLSNNSQPQATSVVDSIAQTMVGEWMFKYVRRRKSFGVSDNNNVDETAANGARHKRWVWLAPYERAVMWSSKQPSSGSALLGKSGRKLTIQSVLDVKDDNPAPKNAGQTAFNRSILILTPARALKFTAVNSERHYIWLTALSFLVHSSQAVPDIQLPSRPKVPQFEIPLKSAARLRRNPIRDSIRVAKGKTSVNQGGPKSVSQYGGSRNGNYSVRSQALTDVSSLSQQRSLPSHARDDSAFSGVGVPRYGGRGERGDYLDHDRDRGYQSSYAGSNLNHSRKRSNTASRIPPPLSYRGFSGPGPATSTSSQLGMVPSLSAYHAPQPSIAGFSINTNASSDIYGGGGGASTYGGGPLSVTGTAATYQMSISGRSSIRTSDVSGSTRPGAAGTNFFDAVGTVRMEAFISPMALMPTGNIGRFDDYMNSDPLLEGMATGFGGDPGSEKSWGGSTTGRERERSSKPRRKSKHRDNNYGNRSKMAGGRRDPDDFYGGSKTAGEEDYTRDPFKGF